MTVQTSLPKKALSKEDVSEALSVDWFNAARRVGKGKFADTIGACSETVDNAITRKNVPELHRALSSLIADPAALFQVFLRCGGCFVPVASSDASDMATISAMLKAATEYFDRMKDGTRDHQDTLALADMFVPLVPAMLAIIQQANEHRSAA